MEKTARDRFNEVLESLENENKITSRTELAKNLGYKPQALSEITNGRTKLSLELIQNFCIKYSISPNYILLGKGEISISESESGTESGTLANKSGTKSGTWLSSTTKPYPKNINTDINLSGEAALQVLEGEGLVGRKVYISPEPAMASYPASYNTESEGGLEYFHMPFLAAKGFYACFLVQGKSMEEYILEGSWVVCRLLEESQQIRSGNLHLIATQSEGLLLKRVRKEPKIKNGDIICYSDNPQYLPFIVKNEDILKVWAVEMFLQKGFPFLSERANKNLENFLDEL